MTWHVQYRKGGSDHIERAPTPEAAIESACHLIDESCDVYGAGAGPLADTIAGNEIARIYAFGRGKSTSLGKFQTETLNGRNSHDKTTESVSTD
jgi:hypothetical protein